MKKNIFEETCNKVQEAKNDHSGICACCGHLFTGFENKLSSPQPKASLYSIPFLV